MAYRRTDNVLRRQAARHDTILKAARDIAAEAGMEAVQIVPVAARADVAAGTVYRYFPSKTELVTALVKTISEREIQAVRRAANAAPGPLSALAAAIATFAGRALRHRRLAWAVIAEFVDGEVESVRLNHRQALSAEFQTRIEAAIVGGHLPAQDSRFAAPALIGGLLEGLIGPLAPDAAVDARRAHEAVQVMTLLSLRALGVVDARARGLVVQIAPAVDDATA